MICLKLWNHKKLHTSQTCEYHLLRIEQLWNHTKLHTSQTRCCRYDYIWCFGTIQNYTPLKQIIYCQITRSRFQTVPKLHTSQTQSFFKSLISTLWNHTKLHTSQTMSSYQNYKNKLWNHTKLHTSQTPQSAQNRKCGLTTIKNYTPLKPKYNM